jgi:hypothetical protein
MVINDVTQTNVPPVIFSFNQMLATRRVLIAQVGFLPILTCQQQPIGEEIDNAALKGCSPLAGKTKQAGMYRVPVFSS